MISKDFEDRRRGIMGGSAGVYRHPTTTRLPLSPTLSTTSEEEGGGDNRKRPEQTREGRAKRRIIAKARTLMYQERMKNLPACPRSDASETKKERKRLQNRRSIEKCRKRELGRLKSLKDEKESLAHDTQILKVALSTLRASGVLEIVAAVRACSEI